MSNMIPIVESACHALMHDLFYPDAPACCSRSVVGDRRSQSAITWYWSRGGDDWTGRGGRRTFVLRARFADYFGYEGVGDPIAYTLIEEGPGRNYRELARFGPDGRILRDADGTPHLAIENDYVVDLGIDPRSPAQQRRDSLDGRGFGRIQRRSSVLASGA